MGWKEGRGRDQGWLGEGVYVYMYELRALLRDHREDDTLSSVLFSPPFILNLEVLGCI